MLVTPENWTKEIPEISTVYNPRDEVWKNCFREHKKYKKEVDCYYSPTRYDNKPKEFNVYNFLQRMKKERNKENKKFYDILNRRSKTPPRRFSLGKVDVCYDMNNGGSPRHLSWNVEGN